MMVQALCRFARLRRWIKDQRRLCEVERTGGQSDVLERSGRIAEPFQVSHAENVAQAEEEIGHGLVRTLDVPPRSQSSAAATGQQDGQVAVRMPIAVRVAAAVDDDGIVQQAPAIYV